MQHGIQQVRPVSRKNHVVQPYTTGSCFPSSGHSAKRLDHRMTSCNRALEINRCESIKTTLRTKRLLWARALVRMSGGRLPKRIVFGNLEGAVRRGRGVKEKEWTDEHSGGL